VSLLETFAGELAETAIKSQAKNLVQSWSAAGYIEPSKDAELEAGLVDFVEVVLGMLAKGSQAKPAGS
jgi:hypothetical protein